MKEELLILLINKWWISVEPDTSFTPVTLPREITEDIRLSVFTKFFVEREKEQEEEMRREESFKVQHFVRKMKKISSSSS